MFCLRAVASHAALTVDGKGIVGRLGGATDLDGGFVDDVAVLWSQSGGIVHVPTQFLEKWIEEFLPELCFVVLAGFVKIEIAPEGFYQLLYGLGSRHGQTSFTGGTLSPEYKCGEWQNKIKAGLLLKSTKDSG